MCCGKNITYVHSTTSPHLSRNLEHGRYWCIRVMGLYRRSKRKKKLTQFVVALLPGWHEIEELRGELRLANNRVYNVRRMSRRRRVPTKWCRKEKTDGLYYCFKLFSTYAALTHIRTCFHVGNTLFPDIKASPTAGLSNLNQPRAAHRPGHKADRKYKEYYRFSEES